jgi:pilus assembly protein CpaE
MKVFVALDEGVPRDAVEAALPGKKEIELTGMVEGLEEAWKALERVPSDLLVVACVGHSEHALKLIGNAVAAQPSRPVIVFSQGTTTLFTREVFAAGADDVIVLPLHPDNVLFAFEKAIARSAGTVAPVPVRRAPIICVLGPKGGTGKTLTATSLSVALAEEGHRVALVDLDLQFGDIGLCLGVNPDATIYDLVRAGGVLDGDKLNAFMLSHDSGVKVLLAPSRPDHAAVVSVEFLRELYPLMRQTFDYVVVDTPPGFTPEVIATIDAASAICMVGMLDVLSLKNTKLGLETLELMGFPSERIHLVLNRAMSRVGITDDDVVAVLGRTPDVFIPSDRDIPRSVNEGTSILVSKPQSEAAAGFRQLASTFAATPAVPRVSTLRRVLAKRAA